MKRLICAALTAVLMAALFAVSVSAAPGDNIASEKNGAKIDSFCNAHPDCPPENMLNDKHAGIGDKWCCINSTTWHKHADPHFIIFDFGAEKSFDKVFLDLCGQYENTNYDAKAFTFEVSNDKVTWVKIADVKDNNKSTWTQMYAAPIKARYLKLVVTEAEQVISADLEPWGTTRIYELIVTESAAAGTFPANAGAVPATVTTTAPPTTTRATTTRAATTTVATTATTAGATTTNDGATTTTGAVAEDEGGGLSMGVIIAIVAGGVVLIGVIAFIVAKGKKK